MCSVFFYVLVCEVGPQEETQKIPGSKVDHTHSIEAGGMACGTVPHEKAEACGEAEVQA